MDFGKLTQPEDFSGKLERLLSCPDVSELSKSLQGCVHRPPSQIITVEINERDVGLAEQTLMCSVFGTKRIYIAQHGAKLTNLPTGQLNKLSLSKLHLVSIESHQLMDVVGASKLASPSSVLMMAALQKRLIESMWHDDEQLFVGFDVNNKRPIYLRHDGAKRFMLGYYDAVIHNTVIAYAS